MASFFSLVTELETLLGQLNTILAGADDETVQVSGVTKDSISKAIRDKFQMLESLMQGRLAFETKAELVASGEPSTDVLAQVWNDMEPLNNGLYGWSSGQWVKSKYGNESDSLFTDLLVSKQRLVRLEESMNEGGINQYLNSNEEVTPVIIDGENKVALGLYTDTGELKTPGLDRIKSEQSRYVPIIADELGQFSLIVDKHTGQLLFDPHYSSVSLGINRVGIFERDLPDVAFAIVDENQQIALSISKEGHILSGNNNLSFEPRDISKSKDSADSEINHFLFSGQSLSVGAAGKPAITLSQPYSNITFTGGPRSNVDELTSFKALVEDDRLAPDGGSNRGETVVSGAANYVTKLIEDENGIKFNNHSYDILGSTVGHGGYRIDQLNKQSNWYQYLIAHVQAGFDLSQSLGKSYSVQAIGWIQGENDQFDASKNRIDYKNDLIQYQSDVQGDVQSITGQKHSVPLLTYQLSCYVTRGIEYQNVTLAQLDAAEESNSIFLVTPMYIFPYSDGVHLNNIGYKWLGHYFGKVYKRVVYEGKNWVPLSPKSINSQGRIIIVEMNVPVPPIVIDIDTLPETKDYGFSVNDDSGNLVIESVSVIGPDRVKIIVDRNLGENPELSYALENKAYGLTHTDGGSGNLRDSEPLAWSMDDESYSLHNWCVMFKKPIN